jgi:hypothetical protein
VTVDRKTCAFWTPMFLREGDSIEIDAGEIIDHNFERESARKCRESFDVVAIALARVNRGVGPDFFGTRDSSCT